MAIKFCGNWNIPFPSHGILASSPWRIKLESSSFVLHHFLSSPSPYHLAGLNNTAARKLGCYARERTGMVQCTPALKINPYNNQENNSLLTWVFRKSWRLCWYFNLTCRRTVISFFEMLQALCSQATVSVQIKTVTDILWSLFWVVMDGASSKCCILDVYSKQESTQMKPQVGNTSINRHYFQNWWNKTNLIEFIHMHTSLANTLFPRN